jgi:DNA-binding XRE family transcriptional regulator
MEFAQQLKAIRKEKGMNQMQMAKFLNVSDACICNWEKGKFTPNRTGIKLLNEKLGIDFSDLTKGINNFYHLKIILQQMPQESVLKIFESRQLEDLVDGLKWAIVTGHTKDEMMYIGLITMGLMERCFMNGFEFEACLSMAMKQWIKETK